DYALESATRILNMVPIKKFDKTPYELWYGKVPNMSYLKEMMCYHFYFPLENKIVVGRHAEFFKKNLSCQEVSRRARELKEIQDEDASPYENTSEISMEVKDVEEHSLEDLNEPTNYKASMLDSESDKRLDVMNAEMQSMKGNQVWCLIDLPPNETFSPVADIRAIRILIAIMAFYDYEIWKMDVKTAFLNGYLDEDVYISFFFFSSIAVQTSGSGISNLLAVATTFTGSGNLYCQWEHLTWQWECLVHFIPKILNGTSVRLYLINPYSLGPTFNQIKGTCSSSIELEYNFQECFNALTNKLNWNNPKGDCYPFDLSKPLPLQGPPELTYTTSIEIKGIEDMVPTLWSTIKHAYDKDALIGIKH
nr:hypothetical protein [Tanacetum cinerariifolium]